MPICKKHPHTPGDACLLYSLPAENVPDRFQITVAIQIVRFQIAGFDPFIPAIHSNQRTVIMLIGKILYILQKLFKIIRRIVPFFD